MQDLLLEIPYQSRTGTGKSFTGVEAIRHLLKVPSSLLDPEPESPHLERPCFMFPSSTWVSLFLGERHENHVYRQFELQQLTVLGPDLFWFYPYFVLATCSYR